MKKLIVSLILFIMVGFSVFGQDEPKKTFSDQTSEIINTLYDKTSEAISDIATALKVPAEHVYTVLVRQYVNKAITGVFVIVLLLIIVFTLWNLHKYFYAKHLKDPNVVKDLEQGYSVGTENSQFGVFSVIVGILFIITIMATIVVTLGLSSDIITGFFNPEYGAIQEILRIVK